MGHEGGGRERGARGEVSLQNSFHGARHKVAKMAVRVEGRLTDIQTGRIRFHEYNVICRNLIC